MEETLLTLSAQVGTVLAERGLTVATAESCTGGLLSHILTGVSGASQYFIGGVVAYSNAIKESSLNVPQITIQKHGAVSAETARAMAAGIRTNFETDFGLSTTGVAGPTGGTPAKPVGLVWIGISTASRTRAYECHFEGDRAMVKSSTVEEVLTVLLNLLKDDPD